MQLRACTFRAVDKKPVRAHKSDKNDAVGKFGWKIMEIIVIIKYFVFGGRALPLSVQP